MNFSQMNQQKHVKQAARGQRQIYEENKTTLMSYFMASISCTILVTSLDVFLFIPSTGDWIGLILSAICEFSSLAFMSTMMKDVRNERNQIVDAGLDLNDPGAFGEYCKDIIILSILTQLLGLISAYFFLLLLIIPGFAAYKLWVNILAPWFFAPAPEVDENDAGNKRKQKKREKTVYVRR